MGKRTPSFSLPGFACLAPSIYVQDARLNPRDSQTSLEGPSSISSFCLPHAPAAKLSARSRDTAPPDLIIITSWTGAAPKHVAKYTAAYNALYPGVPILVITTVLSDLALHSTTHKLRALAPAVSYIISLQSTSPHLYHPAPYPNPPPHHNYQHHPQNTPQILLHAFSEGGAHKAVLLARAYLSSSPSKSQRLPLGALILDSTPGRASYTRATTAFTRALPCRDNPLVAKVLGPGLAVGVVGVNWVGVRLRGGFGDPELGGEINNRKRGQGKGGFIEETRRALNDERLWDVRRVPRTYLFGEEDEVVWWRDVHDHGVESATVNRGNSDGGGFGEEERQGVGSLMVKFKKTEHCAHARGPVNGEVYWAAVRRTWEMKEDGGMGLRLGLGRRLSLDSLCGGDDEGGW